MKGDAARKDLVGHEDRALTPRELARLLRAFAHMIEAAANDPGPELPRPVRRHSRAAALPAASPLTQARATAALKKLGVLP
ncbi:uncharacterized protein SOCE836_040930 [Sorangium cellulosum]|uniref:Uncharacterized protein n=1 Tax=Sorangium cellulosum TaxID=56 RepID=A0A4P2QP72_SORCE|nr:uncharacterized protein SOCE836_040930 [Sorangium cellulosum]WCQ91331.1 hypothetical protein NQZ70_04047 [Sorangium sp. Soce836]